MFSPSKGALCFYSSATRPVPDNCGSVGCGVYGVNFSTTANGFNGRISAVFGTHRLNGDTVRPHPSCSNECVVFAVDSCNYFPV